MVYELLGTAVEPVSVQGSGKTIRVSGWEGVRKQWK